MLIYTLVRNRFRRGAPEPLQVRGNTALEVGWTIAATAITVVLAVITFAMLGGIVTPPPSGPAGVSGADGRLVASTDQAPVPAAAVLRSRSASTASSTCGATTTPACGAGCSPTTRWSCRPTPRWCSTITSQDVAHSWWIPELGGKMDALPGPLQPDVVQGDAARGSSAASAPSFAVRTTRR